MKHTANTSEPTHTVAATSATSRKQRGAQMYHRARVGVLQRDVGARTGRHRDQHDHPHRDQPGGEQHPPHPPSPSPSPWPRRRRGPAARTVSDPASSPHSPRRIRPSAASCSVGSAARSSATTHCQVTATAAALIGSIASPPDGSPATMTPSAAKSSKGLLRNRYPQRPAPPSRGGRLSTGAQYSSEPPSRTALQPQPHRRRPARHQRGGDQRVQHHESRRRHRRTQPHPLPGDPSPAGDQ